MTAGNPGPVNPDRYVAALDGADPFESMRKAPKRLKKLLKGVGTKRLERRPESGGWSIKEVLAHLADGEVMLGSRFRMVAAMERPAIPGYDQDAFVERLCLERIDAATLLEDFSHARAANVRLLERLPDEAFARVGLHSERGEESLARMLVMYAGHDRIHEAQVARLLEHKRARKAETVAPAKAPKGSKKHKSKQSKAPRQSESAAVPTKVGA